MRVFILASWYPCAANPVLGAFVEDQALALARRHEVVVIAPEPLSWRKSILSWMRPPVSIEHCGGMNVVRVQAGTPWPYSWRARQWAYARAARRAFDHAVRLFGLPDLLHAHVVLPAGDAAVRIAMAYDLPVVLTEHSSDFRAMHLSGRVRTSRTAETLARVDAVVAVSPAMEAQILSFRPETEVRIVGNAVDTEFFSPDPQASSSQPSQEFRVLSVGLLTKRKGMDQVIEAVIRAAARIPRRITLTIVGEGPDRARLQAAAGNSALAGEIRFLGALDRSHVRDTMRASDLFVLASERETFGVVVAEAMACGCPVIATRCGGPEWVVGAGTGILVPLGSPDSLADEIVNVALGQARIDTEAARTSIIERFQSDIVARQLEDLYQEVIHRKANPAHLDGL